MQIEYNIQSRYGGNRKLTIDTKQPEKAIFQMFDVLCIRHSCTYFDPDGGPFVSIGQYLFSLHPGTEANKLAHYKITAFKEISSAEEKIVIYELSLEEDKKGFIDLLKRLVTSTKEREELTKGDIFDTLNPSYYKNLAKYYKDLLKKFRKELRYNNSDATEIQSRQDDSKEF